MKNFEEILNKEIDSVFIQEFEQLPATATVSSGNIQITTGEGLYFANLSLPNSLLGYVKELIKAYCMEIVLTQKNILLATPENSKEIDDISFDISKSVKKNKKLVDQKKMLKDAQHFYNDSQDLFNQTFSKDINDLLKKMTYNSFSLKRFRDEIDTPFSSNQILINEFPLIFHLNTKLNENYAKGESFNCPLGFQFYLTFVNTFLLKDTSLFKKCERLLRLFKLPLVSDVTTKLQNICFVNTVGRGLIRTEILDNISDLNPQEIYNINYLFDSYLLMNGYITYPQQDHSYTLDKLPMHNPVTDKEKKEIKHLTHNIQQSEHNVGAKFTDIDDLFNIYIYIYNKNINNLKEKFCNTEKRRGKILLEAVLTSVLFDSIFHNEFFTSINNSHFYQKIVASTDLKSVYNFCSDYQADLVQLQEDLINIDFLKMAMFFNMNLSAIDKLLYCTSLDSSYSINTISEYYGVINKNAPFNSIISGRMIFLIIYRVLSSVFFNGTLVSSLTEITKDKTIRYSDIVNYYLDIKCNIKTITSEQEYTRNSLGIEDFDLLYMKKITLNQNSESKIKYKNNFLLTYLIYMNTKYRKFYGDLIILNDSIM